MTKPRQGPVPYIISTEYESGEGCEHQAYPPPAKLLTKLHMDPPTRLFDIVSEAEPTLERP